MESPLHVATANFRAVNEQSHGLLPAGGVHGWDHLPAGKCSRLPGGEGRNPARMTVSAFWLPRRQSHALPCTGSGGASLPCESSEEGWFPAAKVELW